MHGAVSSSRESMMAKSLHIEPCRLTVQTRVWLCEHDWLHAVFKVASNHSPRFRLPDLLSACVALVLANDSRRKGLVDYLVTQLTTRDRSCPRRSCDIWIEQFEQLEEAHGQSWNRFPNPKFDLDQIATGCVAVVMGWPDAGETVLQQARNNLLARSRHADPKVN
jgi:hypothetical protein